MGTQPKNTHGIWTQTQPNPYPNFDSGSGITLGYPNFGYPIPALVCLLSKLKIFSIGTSLDQVSLKEILSKTPSVQKDRRKRNFCVSPFINHSNSPHTISSAICRDFYSKQHFISESVSTDSKPSILLGTTKKGLVESPLPLACFLQ